MNDKLLITFTNPELSRIGGPPISYQLCSFI